MKKLLFFLMLWPACTPHAINTGFHQDYPYNKHLDGNKAGCVPVAIAQVINYYQTVEDVPLLIKEIVELSDTELGKRKSGTKIHKIPKVLDRFNIKYEVIGEDIYNYLTKYCKIAIVTVRQNGEYHCVVAEGTKDGKININNGYGGKMTYSRRGLRVKGVNMVQAVAIRK